MWTQRTKTSIALFCMLLFSGATSATVILEWNTVEPTSGIYSINSYWEISDASATGLFGFNSSDVLDFYMQIESDLGTYTFTDENMNQIGGGITPFSIGPDQLLHNGDVAFRNDTFNTLGWYSDPLDPHRPSSQYASFLAISLCGANGCDSRFATGQWRVPEPSTLVLLSLGLLVFGFVVRNKIKQKK